jgi:HD-like signal output (HDOD) protein/ActR/RegA family two-component response regulator
MKRILFVDDDAMVLKALERMLHGMRKEWLMQFAGNGAEALELMAANPADVVVTDMRMPGMTGAELLNEILRRHPKTIRLVLSGYADMEMTLECVGGTHQFLSKPCDGETLRANIQRTMQMDHWLEHSPVKALVSRMTNLPSLPAIYFQILDALRSPKTSIQEVSAAIGQDPAMTAKMLQVVNSAFFGLRQQLADATEAVMHLGLETIKALVLSTQVFSELESNHVARGLMDEVHRHSLATAGMARELARLERLNKQIIDESFTAGLLHEVGRMVLAANIPDQYAEVIARHKREGISLVEAEQRAFNATHAEVGGYLLNLWGLPVTIVEAVTFHHNPRACPNRDFSSLTTVHAADGLLPNGDAVRLDQEYLAEVGVQDRIRVWEETLVKTQPA